jgi:hypothetical protein
MHQMMYTGLSDVVQENVDGIHHPWFGDLGRIYYQVLLDSLLLGATLTSNLQKPAYKTAPIIVWDPVYVPRALLESDTELLRLLSERARLYVEWENTHT